MGMRSACTPFNAFLIAFSFGSHGFRVRAIAGTDDALQTCWGVGVGTNCTDLQVA